MASQRLLEELNQAIAEYLNCSGYKDSLKVFRKEAGLGDVGKNYECVLEQKWVCVMRLQKKVKDLEAILAEIGRNNEVGDSYGEWIPKSREKFTLLGHRASISCVKFHPFSKFVVSSSDDCTIRVWDCETGDYERSLKGHKESVQDLAFDSQGKVLASCSADLSIKLWDFGQSFECIRTMHGHDQNVSSVAFLVGDVYILSASRDKTIKKWVVLTGCCVQTYFGHHEWVRMVRVHPLGEIFASCSNDQTVRVWSTEGRESKLELRGHGHTVECVAWAPETAIAAINEGAGNTISRFRGPFLASGGRDRTVRLWDVDNRGYLFNLIGHENWIRGLSFHPGGKYLLSAGDDKTLRVWDLRYKQCVKILSVQHFCTSVDFNDSRPLVVSGSEDQTVKIWECR